MVMRKGSFEVKQGLQGPGLQSWRQRVASLHFAGDGKKNPWLIEKSLCLQPCLQLPEKEGGAACLTNNPVDQT